MSVLGQRIRQLRHKEPGLKPSWASCWDAPAVLCPYTKGGQRSPDTEMLVRLADVFDVSVDYLPGRAS